MPAFLAEGFLETPTAFGVPLGALLLFLWAMRAINDSRQQSRPTTPTTGNLPRPEPASTAVPRSPRAPTHRFRLSTEAIPLAGEVDSSVVEVLKSGFKSRRGRAVIRFTVRLHEDGPFVIAAGKHESGMLHRDHYGYAQIAGSAGEVISGSVNCPGFTDGKWAIGAFRDAGAIRLA